MFHRTPTFQNRADAGRQLAARLWPYANRDDVLVIGLARGGVPVASAVATLLHAPLDVLIVRKLGYPGHKEVAFGAIASHGMRVLNQHCTKWISPTDIENIIHEEQAELERRQVAYCGQAKPLTLQGKRVLLVDDGIATGASIKAAAEAIRHQYPAKIIIAVPVIPSSTRIELESIADEVIAVVVPDDFTSVGEWYEDFTQTSDAEVKELLDQANLSRKTAENHASLHAH